MMYIMNICETCIFRMSNFVVLHKLNNKELSLISALFEIEATSHLITNNRVVQASHTRGGQKVIHLECREAVVNLQYVSMSTAIYLRFTLTSCYTTGVYKLLPSRTNAAFVRPDLLYIMQLRFFKEIKKLKKKPDHKSS